MVSQNLVNIGSGIIPPPLQEGVYGHALSTGNLDLAGQVQGLWQGLVVDQPVGPRTADPRPGVADRFVTTAGGSSSLPGKVVLQEGDDPSKTDDEAISIPYVVAGQYLDYQKKYLGANSIDNKGWDIWQVTHYGRAYNNAFWDGQYMVYGDGDNKMFSQFSKDFHVGIHEITHGYTEFHAGIDMKSANAANDLSLTAITYGGLDYVGQSGAWNESISDIHAILFSMYRLIEEGKGQTLIKDLKKVDPNFWLLGWRCFVGNNDDGTKSAIRNFEDAPGYNRKDVGKDSQPKHMKNYYKGSADNYGVHINSGILNHWVNQMAGILGELTVEEYLTKFIPILDKAERSMHSKETFKEGAMLTVEMAKKLFPDKPELAQAAEAAWNKVGVLGAGAIDVDQIFEIASDNRIRIFDPKTRLHNDGLRRHSKKDGSSYYSLGRRYDLSKGKEVRQKIKAGATQLAGVDGFVRTAFGLKNMEPVALVVVKDLASVAAGSYPKTLNGLEVVVVQDAGDKGFTWA